MTWNVNIVFVKSNAESHSDNYSPQATTNNPGKGGESDFCNCHIIVLKRQETITNTE